MAVYVVQEVNGRNILPAQKFGKIDVLLPQGQIAFLPGPSIYKLNQKLKDFSDEDYLLLIGDPVAIALCAMVASSYNNGKVKFLKWDRQEGQYIEIESNIYRRLTDG
jgi:hypothetical protein